MSDTNKKNYTANDLLSEFFFDETTEENAPVETAETSPEQAEAAVSESETEEISAEEDDPNGVTDDVEIVVDTLEEDTSEAEKADISVAGKSEWDSLEIAETVSEIFDGSDISEDISPASRVNSAVCEDSENMEENVGNEVEAERETEISRNPKSETENISENKNGNDNPEAAAFGGADDDIDSGFNESPAVRFFKGILPWKGDSVWEVIRKIIFIAASAVFVGAGCMLVSTLIQSKQAVEQKEKDKDVIVTTVATSIDESGNVITIAPTDEEVAEHRFNVAEYYKGINEDYIGYLELSGCDIAEPIVQGSDNDYYLTHAIHGGNNKAGTVFMDYRCTFNDDYISPNIVFYGHNQEDGTMFGNLKDYKQNVRFYEENPVVKFSTENETYEYLIYGFFVTNALANQDSNGFVFHYQDYIEALDDERTFNWYREMVLERNQIISPVDVEYGDKLLCLSTCSNEFSNSRFVVFARMLREDEEIDDFDFSEAYLNPNAKGVDWEAIMSGETSATEAEVLDEDDEDGMEFGNGFLQTAVHGTRRPLLTEKTEETTVPLEENDGDNTEKTTKKKTSKKTSETAEESDVLSEATRRSSSDTDVSEKKTDTSELSAKKKKTEKTEKTEETEKEPDGETVTRASKKTAAKRTETETTAPAETAPPQPPDDGSSETVTAG
ncbi:MAG: sortase [Oscillospiraceae bacterium]|nr:sortase [Oscillospiraceae bacterium]